MDTLSLAIVPPQGQQQHAHGSSMIDNTLSSDGVWVAPPEQQIRQQPQPTPSFSHLQPQRPRQNGAKTCFVSLSFYSILL